MPFKLRDCQRDFLIAIQTELETYQRVLGVAPTGFGKTVCFIVMAGGAAKKNLTSLILVHRSFLIDQTSAALTEQGVPHGIIAPGRKRTNDLVQIASIQTITRQLHKHEVPDLIVWDECHHIMAKTFIRIWEWAKHHSRLVGLSASPEHGGRGLGNVFETLVEGPQVSWLTSNINADTGLTYLSPPRVFAPPKVVDLSRVSTKFGDYNTEQLAAAMNTAKVTGDAIKHYKRYAYGLPAVAFCVTIDHAKSVAAKFKAEGIPAASVDGSMTEEEKARWISALARGEIMVLASCELLGEGFDLGRFGATVDCGILLRPTQSTPVYIQQVGRALRVKPGKPNAIILDHVGNVLVHGMPDEDRQWTLDAGLVREKTGKAQPGCKTCPECYRANPNTAQVCDECGYSFQRAARKLTEDHKTDLVEVSREEVGQAQLTLAEKLALRKKAKTLDDLYKVAELLKYKSGWAEQQYRLRLKYKMPPGAVEAQIRKERLEIAEKRRSGSEGKQDQGQDPRGAVTGGLPAVQQSLWGGMGGNRSARAKKTGNARVSKAN